MIVDTLGNVDMRRWELVRWLRHPRESVVEFCDRCAQVCDAACRADAGRERARMQALLVGGRV